MIIDNCRISEKDDDGRSVDEEIVNLSPVQFSKLRTFIVADVIMRTRWFLLSIIKASNLIELGLINTKVQYGAAKLFVNLVTCNSRLKILHLPPVASSLFLIYASAHPNVQYRLTELSFDLHLSRDLDDFSGDILNFVETQRDTLKCLRLQNCHLRQQHSERLLSLRLELLEIHFGILELPQDSECENNTIESLAFIDNFSFKFETIDTFVKCCKNLAVFVAFTRPVALLTEARMLWESIDTDEKRPVPLRFADLRSLRFAGAASASAFMAQGSAWRRFHTYVDKSKDVSVEKHPYSKINFRKLQIN